MQELHALSLTGCPVDLAALSPEKSLREREDATAALTQCPARRMQMFLPSKSSSAAAAFPSYPLFHPKIQILRFPLHPPPLHRRLVPLFLTVRGVTHHPPIRRTRANLRAPSLRAGVRRGPLQTSPERARGAGVPEPGRRGRYALERTGGPRLASSRLAATLARRGRPDGAPAVAPPGEIGCCLARALGGKDSG